jgi:hypothetical protein
LSASSFSRSCTLFSASSAFKSALFKLMKKQINKMKLSLKKKKKKKKKKTSVVFLKMRSVF